MSSVDANFTQAKLSVNFKNDMTMQLNILLLGMLALIALIWLFAVTQYFARIDPLYLRENQNYQIIDPAPLDQEGISKPALLNWVNEFIMDAFNFNYSNMDRQPSLVAEYLSEKSLQLYRDILEGDRDFAMIKQNQFVVWVKPTAPPEIITGKAFRGRYAWQIRVSLATNFGNARRISSHQSTFDFLVLRVPETEAPMGIQIASFTRRVYGRQAPTEVLQGL